jgi:addiction module RelE/StbE family toxin
MGWQIIIAPSAQSDLADIVRYIARHNSDAAARLGFELITRAESLTQFPEIGRMVPEFRLPDLREIICRSYRIIYRLKREDKQIQIIRFWHGARGFPHIPGKI